MVLSPEELAILGTRLEVARRRVQRRPEAGDALDQLAIAGDLTRRAAGAAELRELDAARTPARVRGEPASVSLIPERS
ncbi:MAG: hypothetical protein FJX72_14455 [Armatimonadetes bacterium]|nr:hypothetical protein [Armatimonadota bacterium]